MLLLCKGLLMWMYLKECIEEKVELVGRFWRPTREFPLREKTVDVTVSDLPAQSARS